MATVVVQQQSARHSSPSPALNLNTRPRTPTPIPNKHLPFCPAGPTPHVTSPVSSSRTGSIVQTSLLYPPDPFEKLSKSPPIYSVDATTLAAALDHLATHPLPEPRYVFPWLHGLHPENHLQLAFFVNRRPSRRRIPKCLKGLTIVKLGGDLTRARLKGAVPPEEVLASQGTAFIQADPREGFSVRNFHIQTAKLAPLSDIVIYGEDGVDRADLITLAERFAIAQEDWRIKHDPALETPLFNTFVLSSPFHEIEKKYPGLVAVDSRCQVTGKVMDFFHWERVEMCRMSKASEISDNVWLGPSPEVILTSADDLAGTEDFDLLIETSDVASVPGPRSLTKMSRVLCDGPQRLEFPSSGSINLSSDQNRDIDNLINMIRWMYYLANPEEPEQELDADGDIPMISFSEKPRKILIHCPDGYTESSLLAIAYFIFAEGVPVHEAWLRLHCDKNRNFFAYPSDVDFLKNIQQRLLHESPAAQDLNLSSLSEPGWLAKMDGSLPSRILPYMYLGNLIHANNPDMLLALGIRRILSIGEPVDWTDSELDSWGKKNLMFIGQVQDNGIDPLTQQFGRCLEFIQKGRLDGTATLVHCRVGVSRSATICIAEVMASLSLSFPRAYCFVRARRLNVIVQPHLLFTYELLKWEESQSQKRNKPLRRELEWPTIAHEIAAMNKPYSRQ